MTDAASFLVLPRVDALGAVDVGIDAARVLRIVSEAEWVGDQPVDPYLELGVVRTGSPPPFRIVVVRTRTGERALRTTGKLSVRPVDPRLVQPLPDAVLSGAAERALGGIVFADGERALLVLDVDGLVRS